MPDLKDEIEPPDYELEEYPKGAEKYVLLTLSYGRGVDFGDILDLAKAHGLVGYSGVTGVPISFDEE
ncbi:hypothetical protein GCM10009630_26320 [Kribbella jejuensis]|nr:hypothetical protein [Kribbella jejuensis]